MEVIESQPGSMIYGTIVRAIAACAITGEMRVLRHNSVEVNVYPGSNSQDIYEKWCMARDLLYAMMAN